MGLLMQEGQFVSRDEVALVETPTGTASWKPSGFGFLSPIRGLMAVVCLSWTQGLLSFYLFLFFLFGTSSVFQV